MARPRDMVTNRCRNAIAMRPMLLGLLIAVSLVVLALIAPPSAGAHAFLVQTMPRAGERLTDAPREISLLFSEPVVGGEQIDVKTADGEAVATGPIERFNGDAGLRVPLSPVADGVYIVEWQALATDGHLSVGEFAFAVGTAAEIPAASDGNEEATAWPETGASWLALVGALLVFGGLVSEWLVWAPLERRSEQAIPRLPIGWLLSLALLGSVLQWLLVTGQAAATEPLLPGWPDWSGVLTTRPGLLSTAQLALVACALWLIGAPFTRRWVLLPLGLALVTLAARGHSGTTVHWWAAPANAVHLLGVGYWVGALGHLALVSRSLPAEERRPLLADGVRRYAAGALVLVVLVVVSGTISALGQLSRWSDLLNTPYGQVLLVKLGFVLAALVVAAGARWHGLPLGLAPRPRWGSLRRLVRLEAASLLAVLLVAAILANTAQPRPATAEQYLLGPAPLEKPVLRLASLERFVAIHLAATAGQMQIEAVAPSARPATIASILVQGRQPDGTSFDVKPRPCGPGCVTSAFSWQEGTTTVAVTVASEEWGESRVELEVPGPPQPEAPELLRQVTETMRTQSEFTMTERTTSGPEATSETTFAITGSRFVELELYTTGGATDVHPVPANGDNRALTLFLPGSSVWYHLEFDEQHRLQRETIVSPGHQIERSFAYR